MEALEGARRVGGCGRNCLNQCCIPGSGVISYLGAKLPLYAFKKLNVNDGDTGLLGHEKREPPVAFLDSLLLREVN
ncbi:GDP-L-galactose phosphorylase 1-like [Pyrus communis]|uniref:GDP-L-galactose phosphorylase 1-like n=1 Tax=Pyrus communis TaxID=23211 RepID=UPI0035BF31CF